MLAALFYYNLAFALPLASFLILHRLLGKRAEAWFEKMNDFVGRWRARVLVAVLIVLGVVLIVDEIGWLVGRPLIAPGSGGTPRE